MFAPRGLIIAACSRAALDAAPAPEGPVNLLDNGDFGAAAPPPVLGGATPPEIVDGKLVFTDAGTATWAIPETVAGEFYRLTGTIDSLDVGQGVFATIPGSVASDQLAAGPVEWYFVAVSASTDFVLESNGTGNATVDSLALEGPLTPSGEGAELITGGDASSSDGWTLSGTNTSIVDGVFRMSGGGGTKSFLRTADGTIVAGKIYRARLEIAARVAGIAVASVGGTGGGSFNSTGAKQVDFTSQATSQSVGFTAAGFPNMDVDNLSVKELLFD